MRIGNQVSPILNILMRRILSIILPRKGIGLYESTSVVLFPGFSIKIMFADFQTFGK